MSCVRAAALNTSTSQRSERPRSCKALMSAPYPQNVMASAEAGLTGRERASRAAADCVQQDGSEMIARALVVSAWRRESICELSRGWRRHTRYGRVAWGRLTQIKPSETRGRKASFGIVLSEAV